MVPLWSVLLFQGAAALLALWRPRAALLLPLVFHQGYLVRTEVPLGEVGLPTTLLEGLIGIAVFTGSVNMWKRIRGGTGTSGSIGAYAQNIFRGLPRGVVILVGLFLVAATLSAAIASHPKPAWGHWKAFVVEPILYAFVLLPLLRDPTGQRAAARALLLGGLVSAGLSLLAGFASSVVPDILLPPPSTLDFGRIRGIYDVPNSLALILAPLTVFAASLAVTPDVSALRRLARWSLVLFAPTLLATQSFGGLLAASVGSLGVLPWRRAFLSARNAAPGLLLPRGQRRLSLAVLAVLVLFLASGVLLQARSGKLQHALTARSPFAARLQIWQVSLALIRDHPLLGTGLGTFEPAYQAKLHELLRSGAWGQGPGAWRAWRAQGPFPNTQPPLEWLVRDPHNVLLSFWVNTGLLGLLSMGALVARALRRADAHSSTFFTSAARAALLALLVFGLVDVPYLKNDLSLLWWTFLASALISRRPRPDSDSEDR